MPLTVRQFPCLSDNYGFLIRDEETGVAACIDTPDAEAILREAKEAGWRLSFILNTHWHLDHAGGNARVKEATGAVIIGPPEVEKIAPLDRPVGDGDIVTLGATRLKVMDVGGHTSGHIAYYDQADAVAFVGDTLFVMGCGRLFEGTPEQMWASLQKLAELPDETSIFCAHEYTAANARFAVSIDSDPGVRARALRVFSMRERGEPTVPTTIGLEKATNPFLRAPLLHKTKEPAQAFAEVRAAKDVFQG
ncbi:MAG: hydroxyacylglutathione hydrolase [Alphaproteobacteria bacterium]